MCTSRLRTVPLLGYNVWMETRYERGGLTWVDLTAPTTEEVSKVAEEFKLPHLTAEELLLPSSRPRAEFFPSHVYLILHFPAIKHTHTTREQEIDFVIGKNFLITAHYDTIDALHKFAKVLEVNTLLEKSSTDTHAGFLFFYLIKKLYKSVEHEIEAIQRELQLIEEDIFANKEVQMVQAISRSARDLLNLRQAIEPHREILRTLESDGAAFFGHEFAPYLRAIADEYYRVHNHIMRSTDFLHELRETNNSLLSTKENETMRVLTIMALLTFPLALFVAIFDINAKSNPIIGLPYDFWIIVGIVFTIGTSMLMYFRHRKWL